MNSGISFLHELENIFHNDPAYMAGSFVHACIIVSLIYTVISTMYDGRCFYE